MNVQLLYSKSLRVLQEDGLSGVLRSIWGYLRPGPAIDDFDQQYKTDTARNVPLWSCAISSPNARFGIQYQATSENEFIRALHFIGLDPQTFTFIDLGCGKGRTLLIASRFGFKQVIGVEFARELVEIAKDNLAKTHTANATVIHSDVVDFHFPEEHIVIYLYNPFGKDVMRKVLLNLQTSNVKQLYIIYKLPHCADDFDSSGFLKRLGQPSSDITVWQAEHTSLR